MSAHIERLMARLEKATVTSSPSGKRMEAERQKAAKRKAKQLAQRAAAKKAAEDDWVEPYRRGELPVPTLAQDLPARSSKPLTADIRPESKPQKRVYRGPAREVIAYIDRVIARIESGPAPVGFGSGSGIPRATDLIELPQSELWDMLVSAWVRYNRISSKTPSFARWQEKKLELRRVEAYGTALEEQGVPTEVIYRRLGVPTSH